jgi:integrase
MLSDGTLRGIKPQATTYKIADRDGMYVTVSPRGTITFRLDYRLNGRRETLTIGRYGSKDGISLLMARERCMEARKAIAEGQFPSQEKQREKRRMSEAKTFDEFTKRWLEEARMADSTKSMRKSIIDRDIMPVFGNRVMAEIGPEDLRNLCAKVKARGAPATAVHVRDIVKQVFGFAALHGEKAPNPADEVGPSSIATFVAKDRALSPSEIRVMHRVLDATATLPTIRLALRLILLTLVRKSELIEATWDEVDFENAVWTIPKSRMKAGKPHNVYLWLYSAENVPERSREHFNAIKTMELKTARAWAIKEALRQIWSYKSTGWATRFWKRWYFWATHSRLAPIIAAAKLIERHLPNVLTYFKHRITNAVAEGLNSKIATVQKRAFGYRNPDHFKIAVYFHCGGLDLYPSGLTHRKVG